MFTVCEIYAVFIVDGNGGNCSTMVNAWNVGVFGLTVGVVYPDNFHLHSMQSKNITRTSYPDTITLNRALCYISNATRNYRIITCTEYVGGENTCCRILINEIHHIRSNIHVEVAWNFRFGEKKKHSQSIIYAWIGKCIQSRLFNSVNERETNKKKCNTSIMFRPFRHYDK